MRIKTKKIECHIIEQISSCLQEDYYRNVSQLLNGQKSFSNITWIKRVVEGKVCNIFVENFYKIRNLKIADIFISIAHWGKQHWHTWLMHLIKSTVCMVCVINLTQAFICYVGKIYKSFTNHYTSGSFSQTFGCNITKREEKNITFL